LVISKYLALVKALSITSNLDSSLLNLRRLINSLVLIETKLFHTSFISKLGFVLSIGVVAILPKNHVEIFCFLT